MNDGSMSAEDIPLPHIRGDATGHINQLSATQGTAFHLLVVGYSGQTVNS
jgi:hypothetical protein